jgi:hypothetical protein
LKSRSFGSEIAEELSPVTKSHFVALPLLLIRREFSSTIKNAC